MERLTQNNFDYCLEMCEPETQLDCAFYMGQMECVCGEASIYNKLREYEDTGRTPEEVREMFDWSYGPLHKKIGEWLQTEQEGRLVVLPCKIGDKVFYRCRNGEIKKGTISMLQQKADGSWKFRVSDRLGVSDWPAEDLGKLWFLTRAEAEKAMEVSEDA